MKNFYYVFIEYLPENLEKVREQTGGSVEEICNGTIAKRG